MQALVVVIHIIAALAIIILVLLQHGKGADAGAAFGSGASSTMFGSAGSMSFFMKLTGLCAAIFFATSLTLSYLASHRQHHLISFPESTPASMTTVPNQNKPDQPYPSPNQPAQKNAP